MKSFGCDPFGLIRVVTEQQRRTVPLLRRQHADGVDLTLAVPREGWKVLIGQRAAEIAAVPT
jgi:hypothetical protein